MNTSKVTIVMYHFVRDLAASQYPKIKGLDLKLFNEQLNYIGKHYHCVTMEELISSIDHKEKLPPKSLLLTFDDGYIDHYDYVLHELKKRKIQGSFFPPARAVLEYTVLDVNKIHFILAAKEPNYLIKKLFNILDQYRAEYQLHSNDHYFNQLAVANSMDTKEVIFIKRLLQRELPEKLRGIITSDLFEEIIGVDEATFSKQLYMKPDHLKELLREGMHVGHHGYNHYWLNSLPLNELRMEIEKGCSFLKELGVNMENWTMCYPYGAYSPQVIALLEEYKCKLGLTTIVDVADLSRHPRFELPRLDTNDIPKDEKALAERWFSLG